MEKEPVLEEVKRVVELPNPEQNSKEGDKIKILIKNIILKNLQEKNDPKLVHLHKCHHRRRCCLELDSLQYSAWTCYASTASIHHYVFELLLWQHVNSSVVEDLVEEELDIEQQVH